MKRIAIIALLLILLVMLVISGCEVLIDSGEQAIYAFIQPTDSEYWQQVSWGMKGAADEKSAAVEIIELNIIDDYENSLNLLKKNINKGTEAIIIAPFEDEMLEKLLKKAEKKHIPIIYLNELPVFDVPGTLIYSNIANECEKAGMTLAAHIGGSGKVAMLNVPSDSAKASESRDGFITAISNYPDISLVNIFDCGGSRTVTEKVLGDILSVHGDIKGLLAACPETAAGAISVLTSAGLIDDIKIVSLDPTSETLNFINSGSIAASVGQNPYGIGYKAVEAAVQIVAGVTVPDKIDAGYDFYGSENASSNDENNDSIDIDITG